MKATELVMTRESPVFRLFTTRTMISSISLVLTCLKAIMWKLSI